MFTGLVEETGKVAGVKPYGSGLLMTIAADKVLEGTGIGDSVAVNGACQTVTEIGGGTFSVFVSKVTAGVTTLGSFSAGRIVNLERALAASSRLGGHLMLGHVDGTAEIRSVAKDAAGIAVEISAAQNLTRYIVDKGSVAVDGISLTVVSCKSDGFSLYLIPETTAGTAVSEWRVGAIVNIEVDVLAKYVEKLIFNKDQSPAQKDEQRLKRALAEGGFI